MWTFHQSSGVLDHDGAIVGVGYSGSEEDGGKNNPAMEDVPDVGPIPKGEYAIGDPFDDAQMGPVAMRLAPDAANRMFGRSAFLMHGDSVARPGCGSEGCIVMNRDVLDRVASSADNRLTVTL